MDCVVAHDSFPCVRWTCREAVAGGSDRERATLSYHLDVFAGRRGTHHLPTFDVRVQEVDQWLPRAFRHAIYAPLHAGDVALADLRDPVRGNRHSLTHGLEIAAFDRVASLAVVDGQCRGHDDYGDNGGSRRADEPEAHLLHAEVGVTSIGSLFSGIDGLALGVQVATFGRVAWHAEVDPDGARVLAEHWRCPNLGDVTAIDWSRVEPVDVLVGGFPCQDISLAGKGAGIDGERSGLWREFVRAIRALRPHLVFVENVAALLARGFDRVAADLAACGYRFAWSCYSSAEVGAPHRRERLFILAADADGRGLRHAEQRMSRRWAHGVRDQGSAAAVDDGEASDRDGDGCEGLAASRTSTGEQPGDDADGRSAGACEVSGSDRALGADPGTVSAAPVRRLNPAFVEWMMGFPDGWTASVSRRARLRLLGNAVQPQVAQAAFVGLLARLEAV